MDDLVNQMQQFVEDNVDEDMLAQLELTPHFLTSTNLDQLRTLEAATEKRIGQLDKTVAARERQLAESEKLLTSSRVTLTNIQQRINLLTLTPKQLEAVKDYNRTIVQDPGWFELLISKVTWLGIAINAVFAIGSFYLGEWRQRVKERQKQAQTPTDNAAGSPQT